MLGFYEDELIVHDIDNDAFSGTSIDADNATDFSKRKIDSNDAAIQIRCVCTDTGRGRTEEGLVLKLEVVDRIKEDFIFSTCSLHILNLTMNNPITKVTSISGMNEHTYLQLLHICCAL